MRIKSGSVRSRVEEFRESAMGRVSWPLPRFLYPATSASGGKAHPAREGVGETWGTGRVRLCSLFCVRVRRSRTPRVTVKVDGLSSSLPWVLFGRFGRALAFVDTALYAFGLAALTTLNALLARSYTTGSAAPANIWFSACRGPRSPHTALLATPFTMAIA